ncbi:hypothetical protein Metho_0686 [Methanomethylovorans hollandica DSM 15978]|uniref:Uncharacterized protein n=1 Tax=Methanomethylovorans hollandica (strain DSM 15978 / NBRC 107637 / DMS1) TaxID=867904 RepID=L0KUY7_METHD|nr:hypothetical protein [Methanomethylovorans hollandica]AGB48941.1 hypothetical protein Metho_0686 [Methanomethylovorans hollandica DSM 15978]
MTLETIKKRLSELETGHPEKWERVLSLDYEHYEDFLIAAKGNTHELGVIGIVPQADELRSCLLRMESAGCYDEELIETVRNQLHQREEEEKYKKAAY